MVNGMESGASRASSTDISAQARLARRLTDEIRHGADLALFADTAPTRWTDALLAETRFHLAGTMNAVEMAIRLEVSEGDIEVRLAGLPQPWCGPALERQVDLLTPELLAHYRLRAALSVVQRARTDPALSGIRDGLIVADGEGPFSQALAALTLAEQRWTGPMLFDAPLRPDLPAEIFCDLAWTVAALLIIGLARSPAPGDRDPVPAIVQAVDRIITRHDEGGGPFALAQRCARALSGPERQRIAPLALAERRLLLFCALVEGETALQIETVLGSLVDGGSFARLAILRLMGLDEAVAVQLFEMLAPLTGGAAGQDIALMQFIEEYRQTSRDEAEAWLGRMRMPAALAAKLSIIDSAA
jgi:hypothetical protein